MAAPMAAFLVELCRATEYVVTMTAAKPPTTGAMPASSSCSASAPETNATATSGWLDRSAASWHPHPPLWRSPSIAGCTEAVSRPVSGWSRIYPPAVAPPEPPSYRERRQPKEEENVSNLIRAKVLAPVTALMVAGLVLSNVFQSDDPGWRGPVADVSFFAFVLLLLFLVGTFAYALIRHLRGGHRSNPGSAA
jgi:hypothetical protein